MNSSEILSAFQFRHACKKFDSSKKIPEADFNTILEAGRLSPSSLGTEPWKFLIIQNPALREKIKTCSWGAQGQLPTASHVVGLLTRTAKDLDPYGDYFLKDIAGNLKQMSEEAALGAAKKTADMLKDDMEITTPRELEDWALHQAYIVLGNMMTVAALLKIDSCAIEGFNQPTMNKILADEGLLENGRFKLALYAVFGYRQEDPKRPHTRRPAAEVIQWIN